MAPATSITSDDTLTENGAFAELVAWAKERPRWQQDALRRLVLNEELTETDIDDLTEICLNTQQPSNPLTTAHLSDEAGTGEAVALLRIENPTGINALASDQLLEFAKSGLTVIYGDNGSGKSGYVRVLKHACRSLDRGRGILRDVEDTASTKQSAAIAYARGGNELTFPWTPTSPANPDLPAVSIFDSRSANIHVEKTNAVAYIPQPMKVLEVLASACDRIKSKLEAKLLTLSAQTPIALRASKLNADTAAGAFVRALSGKSNLSQLNLLSTLSSAERQRLTTLEGDLAQDPKRAVAQITNQKARFDNLAAALHRHCEAAHDSAFLKRDNLRAACRTTADAAKLTSDQLFTASPLPEIGQATWIALWEAARKYSNEVAYPHKTFPGATANEDLCVLCQQPLDNQTVARWHTFEGFLKGTTKADEDAAAAADSEHTTKIAEMRMPIANIRQLLDLIQFEIGNIELAEEVRSVAILSAWRLRALLRDRPATGADPVLPTSKLSEVSLSLATRASQLSAAENTPARLALIKEHCELKDREILSALVEDIKAEIERLKTADSINKALKETAKKPVTTKNKEFSEKMVTNALRGRFAREIEKMKLARMPIELKKIKDQNAVSYFQVCLVEHPSESVGEIFSEGEHRCVALAAFLAELVTSKQHSGIVFDDPMSSLDHIHRKAVAGRLVEEAEHRQVIIFTHDLAFLYEIRREAEAKERSITYQTVRRKSARPGYVERELPNKAKSAVQLANALRSELKDAKGQFDHWPDAKRSLFCKGFIEQLREAWDQAIADFIFPVLGRFDNHIKGTSLFKLAVLNTEDVKIVTSARGRLSEELHASAETLNPESVSHADLFSEIAKLEAWLKDIIDRQKAAKAPVTSYAS